MDGRNDKAVANDAKHAVRRRVGALFVEFCNDPQFGLDRSLFEGRLVSRLAGVEAKVSFVWRLSPAAPNVVDQAPRDEGERYWWIKCGDVDMLLPHPANAERWEPRTLDWFELDYA